MHTRTRIRNAILKILADNKVLFEVYNSRGRVTDSPTEPFATVKTGKELSERLAGLRQKRTVAVYIYLYVKQGDASPDTLDDICEIVENLLGADSSLGGVCDDFIYMGSDPDYESGSDKNRATMVLEYQCTYAFEPIVDGDLFEVLFAEFDMASPRNDPQTPVGPDGQIDASTEIDLPQ